VGTHVEAIGCFMLSYWWIRNLQYWSNLLDLWHYWYDWNTNILCSMLL